ncbi:hypothetical protein [Pelosinus propionicus]|uniref:Uncharacterized protein n=1 Tax=Pelosinus propionicus DSM 13327 TaxID=1123291 RepID=A0A1I4LIK5_9FIRM|nr:hypothetical protein [Pelosinus propionicus]SFL90741.1 hypothetical protein SAMN04490355_10256 [Pelosinus propionicus DSM 13327]
MSKINSSSEWSFLGEFISVISKIKGYLLLFVVLIYFNDYIVYTRLLDFSFGEYIVDIALFGSYQKVALLVFTILVLIPFGIVVIPYMIYKTIRLKNPVFSIFASYLIFTTIFGYNYFAEMKNNWELPIIKRMANVGLILLPGYFIFLIKWFLALLHKVRVYKLSFSQLFELAKSKGLIWGEKNKYAVTVSVFVFFIIILSDKHSNWHYAFFLISLSFMCLLGRAFRWGLKLKRIKRKAKVSKYVTIIFLASIIFIVQSISYFNTLWYRDWIFGRKATFPAFNSTLNLIFSTEAEGVLNINYPISKDYFLQGIFKQFYDERLIKISENTISVIPDRTRDLDSIDYINVFLHHTVIEYHSGRVYKLPISDAKYLLFLKPTTRETNRLVVLLVNRDTLEKYKMIMYNNFRY